VQTVKARTAFALLLLFGITSVPAASEVVQRGTLRVSFSGGLSPKKLPRHGGAPISVEIGGRISTTDGTDPPGLSRIEIAINRRGHLDPSALPSCRLDQIQPASTGYARRICAGAMVGEGSFNAAVIIPEQSPYPSHGAVTAFNGVVHGHPVVLLHIYGTEPLPTSFTLPLSIARGHGNFGVVLSGSLPSVDVHVGFVTGISLRLDGRHGRSNRHYLSAGCPAPDGFTSAIFPLARASFSFIGAPALRSTVISTCSARG
jgi:hypothetical protein